MASLKLLIIACALLLVQAQAHPQPQVKLIITDIIKEALPKVENTIDRILNTTGEIFAEGAEDPVAFQKNSVKRFDAKVEKVLDGINGRLDTIKENSGNETGKVVDCVKDARVPSKELIVNVYDRSTSCMAPKVKDLMRKLANFQPDLQEIKTKVFAAADKVQNCEERFDKYGQCLAEVINDVLDALRSTPDEVMEKAVDIYKTMLNKLFWNFPNCILPSISQANSEGMKVVDTITNCIVS